MARRHEVRLHDKVNEQIGFMRSTLGGIALDVLGEKLEKKELHTSREREIAKSCCDEIVKRFRVAMPTMKPDEE